MANHSYNGNWTNNGLDPSCETQQEDCQHSNSNGQLAEVDVEVTTGYNQTPLATNDGNIYTENSLGTNVNLGFTVGKRNYDKSNTFLFNTKLTGGTDLGGEVSLYNKTLWAQSRDEKHELAGTFKAYANHTEKLCNLTNIQPDDYKSFTPKYSTTEAGVKLGMQYNYRHRLYIDGNVGGIFMHNVNKSDETPTTYNAGGVTFGGGVKYIVRTRSDNPVVPYFKANVEGKSIVYRDEQSPINYNLAKPQIGASLTFGIGF